MSVFCYTRFFQLYHQKNEICCFSYALRHWQRNEMKWEMWQQCNSTWKPSQQVSPPLPVLSLDPRAELPRASWFIHSAPLIAQLSTNNLQFQFNSSEIGDLNKFEEPGESTFCDSKWFLPELMLFLYFIPTRKRYRIYILSQK